jgi:hypothetical protein
MQCGEKIGRNGQRHTIKNIKVSLNKEHSKLLGQTPPPEKGAKVLDNTTRADYKMTNGVFVKRKIRLCVCSNQQVE